MIAIKEVDHNLQTVEKTRRGGNRNRMASVAPVQRLQHLSDGHKKHQRRNVTIALSGKALQALLVGLHAPGRLGMVLDQVQGLPVPAAGLEFQLS